MERRYLEAIGLIPPAEEELPADAEAARTDGDASADEEDDGVLVTLDLGSGPQDIPGCVITDFFRADLDVIGFAPPTFKLQLAALRPGRQPGTEVATFTNLCGRTAIRAVRALRVSQTLPCGRVPPISTIIEVFGAVEVEGGKTELPQRWVDKKDAVCGCYDLLCLWHQPSVADFASLVEVSEVLPSVYCLHMDSRVVLASMFLRFEEYYESPNVLFRHSRFTLADFQQWYRTTKQDGDAGGFDYYLKWPGFNLPSWVLDAFRHGSVGPLRPEEEALISCLPAAAASAPHYYIIGSCERDEETLHHEMAHGLYFTNPEYRRTVRACLSEVSQDDREAMRQRLLKLGYVDDAEIIWDEMQAYMVDGSKLGSSNVAAIQTKIQDTFRSFSARAFGS